MIWLAIAVLMLAAVVALAWPLVRGRNVAVSRAAYDLQVYKDQLAELARDAERGLITPAEAETARLEIARRMLAAEREAVRESGAAIAAARSPRWMIAVAVATPIVALALYLALGAPQLPDQPLAQRRGTPEMEAALARTRFAEDVAELARRLETRPDDVRGWALLARSYARLDRPAEAVTAWRRVIALSPDDLDHLASFAEALVLANAGLVPQEAEAAFARVRESEPFEPRAMFYGGLARAQAGEMAAALALWTDLLHVTPADAPWRAAVAERRAQAAAHAGIDVSSLKPSPAAEAERVRREAAR